ncbi:adenylate/guanylate cyclase domain-containing protein [Bacteriovorax sp. Seq25_V]|uniref:adenylate/guanylate cyclase domain-containing protein n=1 Tax=Bacteriovorax sp. Seq25_V TaxID=1201288 RepID=UPI000389E7FD|nr:adenylate/guanylate cyclase domain-containing protein [Bacteriovorax sp. Seq25_V]EQC47228.1 CHASE2 domain protein [Bacteriovorax sp. Seq25_V]
MKKKIWPFQIPFIILLSFLMIVYKYGENGRIENNFIREHIYPTTQLISRNFTDLKFKLTPQRKPINKIVIVGIDSNSLEAIGRWPWSRDYMALLLESIMRHDPKVVGLDIVFSERDQRVPDELANFLRKNKLGSIINNFETDYIFQNTIKKYSEKLVLGWVTETNCRPAFDPVCRQYILDPSYVEAHPVDYQRFSIPFKKAGFDNQLTPLMSIIDPIANIDLFNSVASHVGVLNITPDADGIVRSADLVFYMDNQAYPVLPLEMALTGTNDKLEIELSDKLLIEKLLFQNEKRELKLNNLGKLNINFLGDKFSFPYVSALDLMGEGDEVKLMDGGDTIYSKKELLKDAYVLVGLTAVAAFDTRSFPTGENIPGVEGHATILDNLLSDTYFYTYDLSTEIIINLLIMIAGGIVFNYICVHMSAMRSFGFYLLIMTSIGYADLIFLFEKNIKWENAFVFIEFNIIYFLAVLIKYIIEERDKKFFKEAFGNYISPELIGQMYESGSMPQLGGATRHLTAFFTDIQSFSTFSEALTPDRLVELLNEYLTVMTDILINNGGTLDKYEGDAIIAFFGAPLEFEDHAFRSCKVAVEMQESLVKLRHKWKLMGDVYPEYVREMKMRIGINTGLILSGNMGSRKRMNYTMMGDDVNLAARLESSAKQYGVYIHVSESTYNEANENFLFRELDTIRVVGRKSATKTYELLCRKEDAPEAMQKLVHLFEGALILYRDKNWREALSKFAECLILEDQRFPDVKIPLNPSLVYIERCEHFILEPPDENWDGVFELIDK